MVWVVKTSTEREGAASSDQPKLKTKALITIKITIEVFSGGKWWLIKINRRKYTLSQFNHKYQTLNAVLQTLACCF
jgi:hypothetical protein